jgi:hypothetical protein
MADLPLPYAFGSPFQRVAAWRRIAIDTYIRSARSSAPFDVEESTIGRGVNQAMPLADCRILTR